MRQHAVYICQQCGYQTPSWLGKCPQCGEWNTLVETLTQRESLPSQLLQAEKFLLSLADVESSERKRLSTGLSEFDRVLGGSGHNYGLVPGSVVLTAGEPGIGKSTLLLQLAVNVAQRLAKDASRQGQASALYVAGEESPQQIKIRAERIVRGGRLPPNLLVLPETDADVACAAAEKILPKLVIVDSIQTLTVAELGGAAGSIGQVREVAAKFHRLAKKLNIPTILVGHVTKEGVIAGPKVVEHLVDAVLYLEGDQFHTYRLLRGVKNRFGSVSEVGVFEMKSEGLVEVTNPSQFFLKASKLGQPGAVVTSVLSGARAILTEIQALTVPTGFGMPRRTANGVDFNRLQMILAVLARHTKLAVGNYDVFVNVAGGLKVIEPAADLAIVVALVSAVKNKPVNNKTIAVGEVGLLGEIRPVPLQDQRIAEAKKMGFNHLLTSEKFKSVCEVVKELF